MSGNPPGANLHVLGGTGFTVASYRVRIAGVMEEGDPFQSDRNSYFVCLQGGTGHSLLCIWIILCRPSLSMGALADATAIMRALRFVFTTLTLSRGSHRNESAAATAAGRCEIAFGRVR